ncbi:MAG: amidohydrolase family protein, partial [Gemmatimonadales bacterium]
MWTRLLAVLLFFSVSAAAQTAAVRAGNLIGPATGTVSRNQVILIKDGKIIAVGPQVRLPADADVIDLSNSWVLPGLMDAHTHLTMNLPPAPAGVSVWESYLLKESSAFRALRGVVNARLVLEAGFTTVRDVGNAADYADTDLRRALEKGWFVGPTILHTGKIIAPYGGQFRHISPEQAPFWQYEYLDADTPDEVRKAVRRNIYYGANAIKLVADNSAYHYTEEELRAAVEESHQAGLAVAVHAYGDHAARRVVLA